MATFRDYLSKGGKKSCTATIRIKRKGVIIHSESETFPTKALAKKWATKKEHFLKFEGGLESAHYKELTLGKVLEWYRDDFDGFSKFGASKLSNINFLINREGFSDLPAIGITTSEIVNYVRGRRLEGTGGSTVNNDLIWLRNAFKTIRVTRDIPLNVDVIDSAVLVCRSEGLVSRSNSRSRRPTISELDSIINHYNGNARTDIPMADIILFAVFSTRRLNEICGIRWEDIDDKKRGVLVRGMKHPTKNIDTFVHIPDRAWEIIQRQPRPQDLGRVFPYNSRSVGASFRRTKKLLGIEDLRFHDLRHEGVSWLFELGMNIPQVAKISGHLSWSSLNRYAHMEGFTTFDKYEDWRISG